MKAAELSDSSGSVSLLKVPCPVFCSIWLFPCLAAADLLFYSQHAVHVSWVELSICHPLLSTFSNMNASYIPLSHIRGWISNPFTLALTILTNVCLWFLTCFLNFLPVVLPSHDTPHVIRQTQHIHCFTKPESHWTSPKSLVIEDIRRVPNTQLQPQHSRELAVKVSSSNRALMGNLACFSEEEAV